MKKLISLALAVLTLALVLAAPVSAAPGKPSYGDVPMYIDGIEMDGKIDDAYTELGLKVATENYPGGKYDSNTKCDIYLLHDGEYLYIAYDVKEAYDFKPENYSKAIEGASSYKGCGTELQFDWFGKGTDTCAKITIWANGQHWASKGAEGKLDTYIKEIKTSYDIAKKTYVLEIKAPFADGAKVGSTIGFYAMITSNDDFANPGQNHILAPKTDKAAANTSSEFYNVTLSDKVVEFEKAPAAAEKAPATFDGIAVLAVVAALSGAGVVVSKKR